MKYQPVLDDEVDKLMADYINNTQRTDLEVSRVGQGQYLFGSKKIHCKILNGKLVVRIGGGYTSIDEFV